MTAKRWFIMLAGVAAAIAILLAAFNVAIDPFGVFGDRLLGWYAADMTNNPKTAKISYISGNSGLYDAFVVGASGSSSISPEKLREYTGDNWYNMFNYGADMAYAEKLTAFLIENTQVKRIFLVLGTQYAAQYDMDRGDPTYYYHPRIEGGIAGYLRFAFANPRYALDKLRNYLGDSYFQAAYDVFLPDSGTYDKSLRDSEAIGSLDEYMVQYPDFASFGGYGEPLAFIDEMAESLERVKAMCDESGVELTVVFPPVLAASVTAYTPAQLGGLFSRVAEVTAFWDFTSSPVSADPRYFYDTTHFRNAVGDMMLARIFGDNSVYCPDGFGQFVTAENAVAAAEAAAAPPVADGNARELTVKLYHHVVAGAATDDSEISVADFRADMERFRGEGYTCVGLQDLMDYTERGVDLPPKPLVITFDDGYMSNYELAYPVLKEFGYQAVIFAIGVSVGADTYKDTGEPITPHFGAAEMREMAGSGLISIQTHTYDMHQTERFDDPCRLGVLRMDGESERDYVHAVTADFARAAAGIEAVTGQPVVALAYPYGLHDRHSETLYRQLGVKITFAGYGTSTIVKGLPQSLYNLRRQ